MGSSSCSTSTPTPWNTTTLSLVSPPLVEMRKVVMKKKSDPDHDFFGPSLSHVIGSIHTHKIHLHDTQAVALEVCGLCVVFIDGMEKPMNELYKIETKIIKVLNNFYFNI